MLNADQKQLIVKGVANRRKSEVFRVRICHVISLFPEALGGLSGGIAEFLGSREFGFVTDLELASISGPLGAVNSEYQFKVSIA